MEAKLNAPLKNTQNNDLKTLQDSYNQCVKSTSIISNTLNINHLQHYKHNIKNKNKTTKKNQNNCSHLPSIKSQEEVIIDDNTQIELNNEKSIFIDELKIKRTTYK